MTTTAETLAPLAPATAEVTGEIRLREAGYLWLCDQLAVLTKRALKLGVATPTLEVLKDELVWVKNYANRDRNEPVDELRRYITVKVVGEAPVLNGWKLLAVVEHLDGANLLKQLPPYEGQIAERYRTTPSTKCEHCNTSRRRNESFVVEQEDGTQIQVGRSCLKDFTGHKNPEQLANLATCFSDLVGRAMNGGDDDEFGPRYRHEKYDDLLRVLVVTSAVCRKHKGFVSRSAVKASGGGSSTSDIVYDLLHPQPCNNQQERLAQAEYTKQYEPCEADQTFAAKALEWARTQQEPGDYCHNLRTIAAQPGVTYKNFALAASIVGSYCNKVRREKAAQKPAVDPSAPVKPASTYQGTIDQRLDLKLTITRLQPISSDFGNSLLYVFEDEAGNVFNWFCSGKDLGEYGVGAKLGVRGTVKAHRDRDGVKQTQLTRVTATAVYSSK